MTATRHPARRRPLGAPLLGGVLLALAACASPPETDEQPLAASWSPVFAHSPGFEPFARQHVAALCRESVLYSHHFEAGTAELTALGRRVLYAMANAHREAPLEVHISPGACAPEELGAARVASVRAFAAELDLLDRAVQVTIGYADGRGAAARDVAARLRAFEQRPMTTPRSLSFELSR